MDMTLNHIIFNTGQQELVSTRDANPPLPIQDRIAMKWLIEQAKKPGGVALDDKVVLKLKTEPYRYSAFLAYGSQEINRIFLFTAGAPTPQTCVTLWKRLCSSMENKYQITTPLKAKPRSPMVVDVAIPCSIPEVMATLYGGRYYDLCQRLGWALLYPKSLEDIPEDVAV